MGISSSSTNSPTACGCRCSTKFVPIGEPQRGDVVVFHYPPDPAINYIKRLVGLPGDHVAVVSDQLIINGSRCRCRCDGRYDDGCYHNMRLSTEVLGTHTPSDALVPDAGRTYGRRRVPPATVALERNYVCVEPTVPGQHDHSDCDEMVVPAGHYLMIGDNRDNSSDGRYLGIRARRSSGRQGDPNLVQLGPAALRRTEWSRIGRRIDNVLKPIGHEP